MLSPQVEGAERCEVGQGVTLEDGARVIGRRVSIGGGTIIGKDVLIRADTVRIGRRCKIEGNFESSWRGGNAALFAMGDCCYIGRESRVLVKEFSLGDYVVLHNHFLANGDAELTIGHNSWMGQNGILNANARLTMGNNVGIGAYSAIWTHGKFGALIDGCLMHKEAPVTIEDDACLWRAVVSPGVTVGRRVTVLPGSILTRDAPPGSCFGGVPAVDLSNKVKTYKKVTKDEQFQMMREFISEFLSKEYPNEYSPGSKDEYLVSHGRKENFRVLLKRKVADGDVGDDDCALIVAMKNATTKAVPGVSLFDLPNRIYTKWFTEPEIKFMWFLNDSRARFVPSPLVGSASN